MGTTISAKNRRNGKIEVRLHWTGTKGKSVISEKHVEFASKCAQMHIDLFGWIMVSILGLGLVFGDQQ